MSGFTHRKWRLSFGNRISRSMIFCQHNLARGVKKRSGTLTLRAYYHLLLTLSASAGRRTAACARHLIGGVIQRWLVPQ